jgi:hypothetical protein
LGFRSDSIGCLVGFPFKFFLFFFFNSVALFILSITLPLARLDYFGGGFIVLWYLRGLCCGLSSRLGRRCFGGRRGWSLKGILRPILVGL